MNNFFNLRGLQKGRSKFDGWTIDPQALAHFNRVIADGGVVPTGLSGVNAFFKTVKSIYNTPDINSAISAAYDPHYLGYKLGAGSGTTLGQAAQKLYSVKSTENLLLQSQTFENASWFKSNSSISANVTTAPDGTLTADKLVEDTANSTHIILPSIFVTIVSGQRYTLSVFAKQSERTRIYLRDNGTSGVGTVFDLSNGTVVLNDANVVSSSISLVENGWYRCQVTYVATTTSANTQVRLINTGTNQTYLGDGVSGVFIWGIQLNTESVALPYTPTTTTAQTLADVTQTTAASQPLLLAHTGENYWFGSGVAANLNTSNLQSAFNFGGDFSMVFDIKPLATTSMEISGCFNSIFYSFALMSSGVLRFNGGGQTISSTSGINTTIRQWVRISRSGNNWLFYTSIDGTTWTQLGTTVVNSVTLSGVSINIRVGEGAGGIALPFNGSIFRGLFYTDATLSTTRADFNPSSYNPATSQTQWSSATGEVWSINVGSATTGYKGVLVDRSIVQSDGIDDQLFQTTLNRPNTLTQYVAFNAYANTGGGGGQIIDSTNVNYSNSIDPESNTTIALLINGGASARGRTKNIRTLGLATAWNEAGVENGLSVNDGTASTNAYTPTPSNIGVRLMARANAAAFANALLSTYLVSNGRDSSTIRTGMYNTIRGFNNNAF